MSPSLNKDFIIIIIIIILLLLLLLLLLLGISQYSNMATKYAYISRVMCRQCFTVWLIRILEKVSIMLNVDVFK